MNQKERRGDARFRTAFEVLNVHPPIEGIALLRNLSTHGVFVEDTSARPEIGKSVQLSVRASDREDAHVLVGKVVRHLANGFALEFAHGEPEVHQLLGADPVAEAPLESPRSRVPGQPEKRASSSTYRDIAVDCCVNAQWISGRICIPAARPLLDQLNQGEAFARVLDAVVPSHAVAMDFFALRTDALDLVIPLDSADAVAEQRVRRIAERPVKCLLPYAVIEGTIGVIDNIRVSDHLLRCNAFIAVRDCQIKLAKGVSAPRDVSRVAMALVNVRRVIGISDLAPANHAGAD
jgi:hypothetical protein